MAIRTIGSHQGFLVVEQDVDGLATLHVIADEGKGQRDIFPLLARSFDEAKVRIDQWIAYEKLMEQPEEDVDFDVDQAGLLA